MRKVIALRSKGKGEVVCLRQIKRAAAINSRMELIQALIPIGLEAVAALLQEEVRSLAGERYDRARPEPGRVRWGRQRSSIYLADQKIPLMVPRIRDRRGNLEIPLQS